MHKKIFLFSIPFFLNILIGYAQNDYTIIGRAIDSETKEAVSYTAVYIAETNIITTANIGGYFEIKVPVIYAKNNLLFSCIGYALTVIEVQEVIAKKQTVFKLKISKTDLPAITLRPNLKPEEILKKTIENLAKNFPTVPYEQNTFHRSTMKADGKYIAFQENVLDIYNGGYNKKYSNDKYRYLNTDLDIFKQIKRSDYLIKNDNHGHVNKYYYDVNGLLRFKKNLLHRAFWCTEKTKNLNIVMKENQTYLDKEVYVLEITLKKIQVKYPLYANEFPYTTTLYIDTEDFAPIKIEANTQNYNQYFVKSTNISTLHTSQMVNTNASVMFTKQNRKYYVQYISFSNTYYDYGWDKQSRPILIEHQAEVIAENTYNNILSDQQLADKYGVFDQHGAVKIPMEAPKIPTYNPAFWQTYSAPPFYDWEKLKKDLEQNETLEQQFIKTSGKPIASPEEEIQIKRKYNKKWQN